MSKLQYIGIDQEISFLENYLDLEKLRFQNRFTYTIDVDKSIHKDSKIPPLLIQPIIENCIKHGFKKIDYQGQIKVNFKSQENKIVISIMDNGLGFGEKKQDPKSLGMQIISERLDIINTTEKSKVSKLKVIDRQSTQGEKGSIVQITLPIKK